MNMDPSRARTTTAAAGHPTSRDADASAHTESSGPISPSHLNSTQARSNPPQRHPSVSLTAALSRAAQNHAQAAHRSSQGPSTSTVRVESVANRQSTSTTTNKETPPKESRVNHHQNADLAAVKTVDGDKPHIPVAKADNEKNKQLKMAEEKAERARKTQQDEALQNLKSDLDNLRTMATCRVCVRLLYEPYTLACGHTFCYSCLCQWFVNNKKNKTCPDCRARVMQQPAPAYLIREMTEIFINRAENLPSGETAAQHRKWQKEESEMVERDRSSTDVAVGGLFKGCFRSTRPGLDLRAIRDEEDGVVRCPRCAWELEEGFCPGCALRFDDDGRVAFGGFSDMDESSDREFSSEELDEEIDMEDADAILGFDTYDDYTGYSDDGSTQYQGSEYDFASANYAIQRALARGHIGPPPRRLAAHSAAHSWRRSTSYSASIVSDMQTSEDGEMETLEEESEEESEEASSLNSFIVDDQPDEQRTRNRASATRLGAGRERGLRRVVTDSTSGESQHQIDDEFDEGGDVSNGRRRRPPTRTQSARRLVNRRPVAPSVSTEEDYEGRDVEEDTEALLRDGWAQLGRGPDDELRGDDDDDTNTTVGWPPSSMVLDRERLGGSITPTVERLRARMRPASRTATRPLADGSRGLRRRSSVISIASTANYENGEAEDEDSDDGSVSMDPDGDVEMEGSPDNQLHTRHIGLPPNLSGLTDTRRAIAPRGTSAADAIDAESDSTSDASVRAPRRRRPTRRRQTEYDPRISLMFAQHQEELRGAVSNFTDASSLDQLETFRTTTPTITRPRTANRRRSSQQLASLDSVIMPSAQNPVQSLSPSTTGSRYPRAGFSASGAGLMSGLQSASSFPGHSSGIRAQSGFPDPVTNPDASLRPLDVPVAGNSSQNQPGGSNDFGLHAFPAASHSNYLGLDRPASRAASLSASAGSVRWNPASRDVGLSSLPHPWIAQTPGLNFAARQLRNPWARFVSPRRSTRTLREQSSTATLRPSNSRRTLREQPSQASVRSGGIPSQSVRVQPSRTTLRHAPSHNRIRSQGSINSMRSVSATPTPQAQISQGAVPGTPTHRPPPNGARRLSDEEARRRGSEVVRRRQEELGVGHGPNNPFSRQLSGQGGRGDSAAPSVDGQRPHAEMGGHTSLSTTQRSTSAPISTGLAASLHTTIADERREATLGRRGSHRNINAASGAAAASAATGGSSSGLSAGVRRTRAGPGVGTSIYGYHVDNLRMSLTNPVANT